MEASSVSSCSSFSSFFCWTTGSLRRPCLAVHVIGPPRENAKQAAGWRGWCARWAVTALPLVLHGNCTAKGGGHSACRLFPTVAVGSAAAACPIKLLSNDNRGKHARQLQQQLR